MRNTRLAGSQPALASSYDPGGGLGAIQRVEAAARELRDAELELEVLTADADRELQAVVLHGDDGRRLRIVRADEN